jgi:hypothetical protein
LQETENDIRFKRVAEVTGKLKNGRNNQIEVLDATVKPYPLR